MDTENDLLIWENIVLNDTKSFDALFNKYFQYLYNYGASLTKEEELVKDAIQDVFLEIWKNRSKIQIKSSVKYYLLQTFRRNLFLKFKEKKRIPFDEYHQEQFLSESIQTEIIREEKRQSVQYNLEQMMQFLTPRQREAIFLKFYRGMDSQEISELMEIDIKAVYKLISTGIMRYRKNLKKQ